jgi:hypothetical protein
MQNLQIPNTAETRIIPKWLFHPASQTKVGLPLDAVLVASTSVKNKKAKD